MPVPISDALARALRAAAALGERLTSAEARLEAADARVDSLQQSRNAPPPAVHAVEPTATVAEATDKGEEKTSHNGRLQHMEWLLDALQSDFEAMHSYPHTRGSNPWRVLTLLGRAPLL